MTKANNKTGSQKPGQVNTKATPAKKPGTGASSTSSRTSQPTSSKPQSAPSISIQSDTTKDQQSGKSRKPPIGGTAVQGAKSTQPKEIKATSSAQQDAESY